MPLFAAVRRAVAHLARPFTGRIGRTSRPRPGAAAEGLEGRSLFAAAPAVSHFALINPETDRQVNVMNDGAVVNLALLPAGRLNLRAYTFPSSPTVGATGSVRFAVDGRAVRVESTAPFALFGDRGPDDFLGGTLAVGTHTLTATPFAGPDATGATGPAKTVRLHVVRQDRPNFVFVYTDDQRWDALGVVQREQGAAGRFPWLRTPNLDRLASEGVRFRNAFVTDSLCSPSRASILTGLYPHEHGVANNHTPFPLGSVTFATGLQGAGYATGYTGKFHMGNQAGKRPGFDFSASFVGQGQYFDVPFEVNGRDVATDGWVDDVTTDFALDFIGDERANPFAVMLGYKSSHVEWAVPDRLKGTLAGAVADPAASAGDPPPFKPNADRPENPDRDRNYFRTLLGVDENVGRLLNTLDRLNLTENTVVVFTSDNGYYLGEHGLGDKRSAYEESIRVPFLVRYPRLAAGGRTVDRMVLNQDVAPTFLDLAGVPVPGRMQGLSLKPLLAGQAQVPWRTSWLYEYFQEDGYEPPVAPPNLLAVRTDHAKLVKYPGHPEWTELFDLRADPYERRNLFNVSSAAGLRQQMLAEFDRAAEAARFRIPPTADYPFSIDVAGRRIGPKAGAKA